MSDSVVRGPRRQRPTEIGAEQPAAPTSVQGADANAGDRRPGAGPVRNKRRRTRTKAAARPSPDAQAHSTGVPTKSVRRDERSYQVQPLPPLHLPDELPVSGSAQEIAAAIAANPVVIVCGETGSGKTTQLPKICVLAGRGERGRIGHTQPRRIAASSVARRIAQELGSPLGQHVGYKVRFGEQLEAGARFKIMTDGILLAETQGDPHLRQYDTIIVDEAHERSLNIDFLLGYLKRLVDGPRRNDLKLVITSATIDAQRFAEHFGQDGTPAPVIEVSGRLYPVQMRYQPRLGNKTGNRLGNKPDGHVDNKPENRSGDRAEDGDGDLPTQIETAVGQLWAQARGDALVFLPGEREIREAAEHLRRAVNANRLGRGDVEIVPLYARLTAEEQQKVFSESRGQRIVLATNVAETSLTVPGIRYVIDSGLARVKRYRLRGKVEQLQIEPVSRAAANQRAGRCGRVADGICVRLYDEADFLARPEFTDPEVLRSSLASVILRMKALHLGDVEDFPFLDPPPTRAINDGYALLSELGAVDEQRRLTSTGQQLARLPVDARIGRMLLAGHQNACLREVLIIAAALATQDPRDRPMDSQQAADQAHKAFIDESSDFLSTLRLWQHWQTAEASRGELELSRNALNRALQKQFLSVRRLREWADVHQQLVRAVQELNWQINEQPGKPEVVHRALLTGLLGNLGCKPPDDAQYQGTHQTRFLIHPASVLTRKQPRWLMAAEMVDTARLFARMVAPIQPTWIEQAAQHLLRRSWSDPFWSSKRGQAMRYETATLYGLVIYTQRRVPLAGQDKAVAREMFIRHALVQGDWPAQDDVRRASFIAHNQRMVESIEKLEQKIRRPDLLVDQQFLFDWFDARLAAQVSDTGSFNQWYRSASKREPDLLKLSRDELLRKDAAGVSSDEFPKMIRMRGVDFHLDYRFEPGEGDDGVTIIVPLSLLNQVDAQRCEWLVSGLLKDKVSALVKSLPQRMRRHMVPLPAYVQAFADRWQDRVGEGSLVDAIRADVRELHAVQTQVNDFRPEVVPTHLNMNFKLVDAHGRQIAMSRSLVQLRARHGEQAAGAFRDAFAAVAGKLNGLNEASAVESMPDAPAATRSTAPTIPPAARMAGAERDGKGGARRDGRGGDMANAEQEVGATLNGSTVELSVGQRFSRWPLEQLPELLEIREPGTGSTLIGFPAFVDQGSTISLEVFDEQSHARAAHRRGVRRLLANALRQPLKALFKNIPDFQNLVIAYARLGTDDQLREQLIDAVLQRAVGDHGEPESRARFETLLAQVRPRLSLIGQELARTLAHILDEYGTASRKIQTVASGASEAEVKSAVADVRTQLDALVHNGFISATPSEQFVHLPRYLKAIVMRLERVRADPGKDTRLRTEVGALNSAYQRLVKDRRGIEDAELQTFRWLIEELRVSLFAQSLRTPTPVSLKRLNKMLQSLR